MRSFAILIPIVMALGACSSTTSPTTSPNPTATTDDTGTGDTPAPGSKFSEIHLGMDKSEVQSIIGQPTDQNAHETGKAFIPFYFGSDTTEIDAHYKGEGVLTYASQAVGSNLYLLKNIAVNTSDTGFTH